MLAWPARRFSPGSVRLLPSNLQVHYRQWQARTFTKGNEKATAIEQGLEMDVGVASSQRGRIAWVVQGEAIYACTVYKMGEVAFIKTPYCLPEDKYSPEKK